MKTLNGFSLIELMVTLAIVAILAALAAPSFTAMLANAQIRTGTRSINDGLTIARVEAIRRNARVVFNLGSKGDWSVVNETDSSTIQNMLSPDGSSSVILSIIPSNATQTTFDSRGHIVANTNGTAAITQVDVTVSTNLLKTSLAKNLRITLASGGAIKLCDPNGVSGVGAGC